MAILDLLESITGEKASPSPTTLSRPAIPAPKRKAADELRDAPSKTPRTEQVSNANPRSNGNSPRPSPRPTDKPAGSLTNRPASTFQGTARPSNTTSQKPSSASSRDAKNVSSASSSKPLPSRALVSRPANTDSGPKPAPKKRSFAEIMARASANTAIRESFGKIQHKPVERSMTMKERKGLKAEEARSAKKGVRPQASGSGKYGGTSDLSRDGASRLTKTTGVSAKSGSAKQKTPPAAEEKKVKKAALATTGYTGTARPRPGAATAKPGSASKPSRAPGRERPRYGGRSRYEEDEELDDFIEYDDEEDEPAYGYGRRVEYDSAEDESDMEAGLSDIDEEERRAAREALREDKEQEALEKRLKQEKEERKRKLLQQAQRAKAR